MKTTRFFTLFAALALTISAYSLPIGTEFAKGDFGYIVSSNIEPYTVVFGGRIQNSTLTEYIIPSTVYYQGITYTVTEIGGFYLREEATSVTIPNTIISIGSEAFANCKKLKSITIPSSVKTMGENVFTGSGLQYLEFNADSITGYPKTSGKSPFYDVNTLKSVKIGDNVKHIFYYFLEDCDSVTSITIPNSVTVLGPWAFSKCKQLTSVVLPNAIKILNSYTFAGTSLTSIDIPNSVTKIGERACSTYTLKNITIGSSVTWIGDKAFPIDGGTVVCKAKIPPTGPGSYFRQASYPNLNTSKLFVDCGLVDTYKAAAGWSEFKTIVDDDFVVRVSPVNYIQGFVTNSRVKCRVESIKAIPRSGFAFLRWNDGNTQNPRTINLTSDTAFVAYFKVVFRVNVQVNNSEMGQVTGEGLYDENSEATITALPKTGYHFVAWNDQNTDNPRTVNVTTDSTFTATFAINTYSVSGSANDAKMGQVTGGKVYEYNTQATIVAVANEGYGFVQWNDGNTQNPRTFTVTSDSAFVATFDAKYTISVTSADAVMGTVVGSGKFMNNTQTTIEATPNDGYAFVQWNDLNTENPRTILVTSDATYTATFMTITAIEQVTAETLNLRIENGTILCDGDMRIYDLIGRDVTHQNGLLQGVYMVRVDNLVVKVIVK